MWSPASTIFTSIVAILVSFEAIWKRVFVKINFKSQNSWMQDPRYKHEYLDKFAKGCLVMKVTNIYKHEIVDTRA